MDIPAHGKLRDFLAKEGNMSTSSTRLVNVSKSGPGFDASRKRIHVVDKERVMALTREYRKTVVERIKRDPRFAKALFAEAVNALLDGETEEGLSMLRDLVHATITFTERAKQTGFNEKSLHRMLSRHGNPTTRTLAIIIHAICQDLGVSAHVKFAAA
jgi:DNA-binding phage protein